MGVVGRALLNDGARAHMGGLGTSARQASEQDPHFFPARPLMGNPLLPSKVQRSSPGGLDSRTAARPLWPSFQLLLLFQLT